jgi:hypothetical protein
MAGHLGVVPVPDASIMATGNRLAQINLQIFWQMSQELVILPYLRKSNC